MQKFTQPLFVRDSKKSGTIEHRRQDLTFGVGKIKSFATHGDSFHFD
jgi:hypothetical protein